MMMLIIVNEPNSPHMLLAEPKKDKHSENLTESTNVVSDDTMKNYNSFLVHDGSSWSTTSAHGGQDEENSS